MKKSEPWVASIRIANQNSTSLLASLACEEVVSKRRDDGTLDIFIQEKAHLICEQNSIQQCVHYEQQVKFWKP